MDWTAFWYYCGWAGIFSVSMATIICGFFGFSYMGHFEGSATPKRLILAGCGIIVGATVLVGAFNATSYATGPHHDQKSLADVAATQVERGEVMLFDAQPIPKAAPQEPPDKMYIPEYQCKIIRAMLAGKKLLYSHMGAWLDGVPCNWRHCQRMKGKGLIEEKPGVFWDYQLTAKARCEFEGAK